MEENIIDTYKKEFRKEIKNENITIETLKKNGVSDFTLLSETYLRKFYGDKILFDKQVASDIDITKKKVEKVDLSKLNVASELAKYINSLSSSEFDTNVDLILTKIEKDDD